MKLVLGFAPWIAFLVIARDTLLRVEIGLVVALALAVLMAVLRLHRGVIMWVSLVFFGAATVAVFGFGNMWVVEHLGVLANGALALAAWATIVMRRPFTLDYARQQTDPAKWHAPLFIRVNYQLTAVWAAVFTFNTLLAWPAVDKALHPSWVGHTLSYVALVGAAVFTSWYPGLVRRRAQRAATTG